VTVSSIPGVTPNGQASGIVNDHFSGGYIHDVHLIFDEPLQTGIGTPFLTGDNCWIELMPGVTLTCGTNANCPIFQNAHQAWVNEFTGGTSGTTPEGIKWTVTSGTVPSVGSTVLPSVSGTAPLFGDQNIMISGARGCLLDGNKLNQSSPGARPGYSYTITYTYPGFSAQSFTFNRFVTILDFSGVKNLVLDGLSMTNQSRFVLFEENCSTVLRRNLVCFKPALSATNNQATPEDDNYHSGGSILHERSYNLASYDNNDNSFTYSPGEYVGALGVDGNGNPVPGQLCFWGSIGSDSDIVVDGYYTNGEGPGFFCNSSTDANLNAEVDNFVFRHVVEENPNPYRRENEDVMDFGIVGSHGLFSDWTIASERFGYGFALGGPASDIHFEDIECALFSGTGAGNTVPFITIGENTFHRISVTGCSVAGSGTTASFIALPVGNTSVDQLVVDSNKISTFAYGVFMQPNDASAVIGDVTGLNTWSNVLGYLSPNGHVLAASGDFSAGVAASSGTANTPAPVSATTSLVPSDTTALGTFTFVHGTTRAAIVMTGSPAAGTLSVPASSSCSPRWPLEGPPRFSDKRQAGGG
jgi:hypothetical protein